MKILYQDNDIIVCIKPAGVMSTDESAGMPDLIREAMGEDVKVRTVHRLDSVVSGLMVYALTQEAASDLTRQIEADTFKKAYYAVVEGVPEKAAGKWTDYLKRNAKERKTYVVNRTGKGVEDAALLYRVVKRTNQLSLVFVELITGRTHQIRAQFSSRKLPLYGDRKYGSQHTDARIALWSCSLTFAHPVTHQTMKFKALPPTGLPWHLFKGYHEDYEESDVVRAFDRRERIGDCPYVEACGGCDYQGVAYDKQLEKKLKMAVKGLKCSAEVSPIIPMADSLHYKYTAVRTFAYAKRGKLLSGVYAKGKRRFVPVSHCQIEDERMETVVTDIRYVMTTCGIEPFDPEHRDGWLKHIVVNLARDTGDMLLTLVAVNAEFKAKTAFIDALVSKHPEIKGIWLDVQSTASPAIYGKEAHLIYGQGFIEDTLLNKTFEISSRTYFPENPVQMEKLYEKALDYADLKTSDRVLHAYCGSGLLSVCAASQAGKVLGVDRYPDMIHKGMVHAKRNRVENLRLTCGEPLEYIEALARSHEQMNVVFIDGLRGRIAKGTLAAALKLKPDKMICLTDDAEAMKEEIASIEKSSYGVQKIQPVDLKPYVKKVGVVMLISEFSSDGES